MLHLSRAQVEKAGPELTNVLVGARGDEPVVAILTLSPRKGSKPREDQPHKPPYVDPASFESRTAYRQTLIDQRERVVGDEIGDVIDRLRGLKLIVEAGRLSPLVVVRGRAEAVAQALKLPEVLEAKLNQHFKLIEPVRR